MELSLGRNEPENRKLPLDSGGIWRNTAARMPLPVFKAAFPV
jgi:hypothetical protein